MKISGEVVRGLNGELEVVRVSKLTNSNADTIVVEPGKPYHVGYYTEITHQIQCHHKIL